MAKALEDIAGDAAKAVMQELGKLGIKIGGVVVVVQISDQNGWAMAGNIHPSILIPNTLIALSEVEEAEGNGTVH